VAPRLPPAWLDANELEQVLANLVNNAVDAMDGGGTVAVSARKEGSHILLQVADDGTGSQPENLARIFQPFFTTKPLGQGTGLGLAVVYGIVQGWGGTHPGGEQAGIGDHHVHPDSPGSGSRAFGRLARGLIEGPEQDPGRLPSQKGETMSQTRPNIRLLMVDDERDFPPGRGARDGPAGLRRDPGGEAGSGPWSFWTSGPSTWWFWT
jgi:hypothetical protein